MRRTNMEDAVGLLAVRRFGPALATLAIMFSAPAYAGIVYSQPGNGTACSPTCWTSSFDGTTTSYLTTDNFSLSKAASIETVQWQGFYYDYLNPSNNPVSPNTNFWEIVFYADVSGLPSPSSLLYEQAPSQVTSTLLGTSTFGGNTVDVYNFTATLPFAFNASANTTYWFGPLSEQTNFNPFFSWSAAATQPPNAYSAQLNFDPIANPSDVFISRPDDRAFTLSSSVPEPSTWALMVIGFAGVGFAGYRRAKQGQTALPA